MSLIGLARQELARRMIRSRNWHLYQAGAARNRAVNELNEVERHEHEADRIAAELRDLGVDPQPPMGPRAA